MIILKPGDKVVTKKPHACGCADWTVIRTGADVKLRCDNCGRIVLLSSDKAVRALKSLNGVKSAKLISAEDGEPCQ